jgi:hypothetical protein
VSGLVAAPGLGAGTVLTGSSTDPERPQSVGDPAPESLASQTVTVHAYVQTSGGWADVVDTFSGPYAEVGLTVTEPPNNYQEVAYFPTKAPQLVGMGLARSSDGSVWLAYVKNRLDVTYDSKASSSSYPMPVTDSSLMTLVVVQIPTDGSTVPTRRGRRTWATTTAVAAASPCPRAALGSRS